MPRVRQRRHERRSWTDDQLWLLCDGSGLHETDWGTYLDYPLGRRHEWPSTETLEDMEAAWQHHGAQLKAQHPDERPLFGELLFEHGLTADEARDKHNWDFRERHGMKHYDPSRPGKLIGE